MSPGTDFPAFLETEEGLRLEHPAEPSELRTRLRERALEHHIGAGYESCFAAWLWERWMVGLEPVGFGREAFVDAVGGYRREIWYWLLGDRSWEQLIGGLAGRVSRRVPNS